jgi:hypothetical protein
MAVLTSGSFPFINANALKIKVHSEFLTPTRTAIDPGALHIWSQTRILPFSCHSLTDVPSCSQIGWNDTWQTLGSYQVAKISALLSLDFVCFCSKNSLYFSDPSWDLSYLIRPWWRCCFGFLVLIRLLKEQTKFQCLPIINRLSNRWRTKYRYNVVTSQIRQFVRNGDWGNQVYLELIFRAIFRARKNKI